ncbi:MAG: efflux RND transporter periplasmic adaptor subunit [Bacteroidales bacterium]|jgi:HlyD family secretion protein|nr:efflux RND transporter periplasmic adaptor subunit [Bacteroidales bacterium]MDD2264201.1 efflux RND transporter periplasmic adaptor subunit [Bacteroidales bacterium]MDD2831327.1 efflux RND transporter periplasmic adaptor subunit [Bacteroidales bacterium]MDD3208322.1 efflux RND transporter periplasmic adaptor subunit [Bacteroidales bacterium]MDD3696995.1 efflux RND transporter periplasmic adaptor subunit [Bacteroidales bacterium]
MKKSILWIIISAVVLIVILIIAGRSRSRKGTPVTVANPVVKNITEIIPANGKIQPVTEVKISPDVSGEIVVLNVAEGDHVKAGQVLLQIKQDQYISARDRMKAALNQARAQLAQQEAQFTQVELSYNRNVSLHQQGAISQAEFEASSSEYAIAREQLNAAKFHVQSSEAALAEAEESLAKTTIFSPMNGIVSKLAVERGERVVGTSQMAGTEMLRIANFEEMEVLVDVNENDIVRIKQLDTAMVEVDAYPGRKFTGIVTQIANSAKNIGSSLEQVTNFEVRVFILPQSYSDLVTVGYATPFRPGMSASVSIQTETRHNVIAIPIQCITTRTELLSDSLRQQLGPNELVEQVFVVRPDNTVEAVRVRSGLQDHIHIEISEGLTQEDKVVTGPYSAISRTLLNSTKVEPKTEQEINKETKENQVRATISVD